MAYIMEAYDNALSQILKDGVKKENRTGVDTIATFGIQSRYRIDENFPILTGRKVWPKAVFAELLWFLSGSTRNEDLKKIGCNFWTPWVDAEWAKERGFVEDAFGPVYGFQLRHFGGAYGNGAKHKKKYLVPYGEGGVDQLQYMLDRIKTNPNCRRILFSLWHPPSLSNQKLPPCHYTFQIFIHEDKMSGMLTQRSCDFPVGVPANIQFYSALIYMLAQQTGYKPYELVHSTVDSHIYVNQIEAVEEYLARPKPDSPKMILKKADDMESYSVDSFEVVDYNPQDKINFEIAV